MNFPKITSPLPRLFCELTAYSILLSLTFILIQSCKEKEKFDVKGDTEFKIFFHEPSMPEYHLTVTSIQTFGKFNAAWPARRTRDENTVSKVTAGIDNRLIDSYNATYKTKYKAFPEDVLLFDNIVNLKAGQSQSTDSIRVSLDKSKSAGMEDGLYLAPVRIISVTSGNISANRNVVYVRLSFYKADKPLTISKKRYGG